ncbi:MAG: NADH-quinone oxidoreductase subunit L, partial [Thermoproteota archaeon]
MATEWLGFDSSGMYAWAVWIIPFVAALIMPAVGKSSKTATGYVAVGFSLMSALSAASLLPAALEAHEIHDQVS